MLRRAQTFRASDYHHLHKEGEALFEKRKKRYPKTPSGKKVPGFDISHTSTEKLELLVSLNLSNNSLTKSLKIKAAHELATRYIEGKESEREHKAPSDQVKAFTYAEKEINGYSIEELEKNFFQIEVAGRNVNVVEFWLDKAKRWSTPLKRDKNDGHTIFHDTKRLYETSEIDKFIDQAEWNGLLKKEKARNANAILLAWEKQLIAARLAEHYKKLKKEKRDADSILAAKFYKRLVHHLQEHEPPDSHISNALKKISPRFNQIRLLLSRLGKIFAVINGSLPAPIRWVFNIASLYFLITFITDLIIIIKDGPQAFWEDNRPSRMANDSVWFVLNFTCLMLAVFLAPIAPPLSALLIGLITVGGCVFDVGAEIGIGVYGKKNQQEMLDNIDAELAKLSYIDVNHRFTHEEIRKYPEGVALKRQYIDQKLALLETRKQLVEKRKELYINRAYTVGIMFILLACAALIFFPFAGLLAAPLIAAGTALIADSVFQKFDINRAYSIGIMIVLTLALCAALIFFPPAGLPLVPIIAAGVALGVGSILGGIGKHIFWNAIMDAEFHTACKEKFKQACNWVKEFFVAKVKAPYHGSDTSPDDWKAYINNTSTEHIQKSLGRKQEYRKSISIDQLIEVPVTKKPSRNYTLHRSSSGDLFSCVPPASPVVGTPAEKVPNIPLSL